MKMEIITIDDPPGTAELQLGIFAVGKQTPS
jgi:hypothetical protein